jgi:hypothetical protein
MVKSIPISRPFDVGRRRAAAAAAAEVVVVEADAAERDRLASFLGIPAVHEMRAEMVVRPWRSIGVRVEGRVVAVLDQACVVTLEPVRQVIDEPIAVAMMPGRPDEGTGAVDIDPLGPDDPEVFDGRTVDLGAIAVEHVALGLDPYPRAPGASFDPGLTADAASGDEEPAASPFASLEDLKRRLSSRS